MKRAFFMAILMVGASFTGCQKQQTEEQRPAEVEREAQQRLAAERQQQLDRREADLNAREQALNESAKQPAAAPAKETARTNESEAPDEPIAGPTGSYSIFYTKLEPYGDWIETSQYSYVYRPRQASDPRWRPYIDGRWVYSDAGWTWISDEPFGWATYHYGRWTRIRGVGWVWVPGNEWAPAWVSWRKGGDYVGWAPLPPEAQFDRRRGIQNWSDSYYDVGPDQYVFVPVQQFGEERIERALVPEQRVLTIVNQTTNVTNITYNNTVVVNLGPSYDELKRQSRVGIPRLRVERQTNMATNEPRPVVRGDVVEVPAPVITSPRSTERPRAVKQKLGQAAVDLGWAAVDNPRDAEQTRAKIKAEATPPPDAPPKSGLAFSGPSTPQASASETPTPAANMLAQPTTTPVPAQTSAPRQTEFPARRGERPLTTAAPLSATPMSSPAQPMTPAVSVREPEGAVSPAPPALRSPRATSTTPAPREAMPDATATISAGGSPEAPVSPAEQRRRFKSAARQFEKQSTVPMPSASATRGAGSSPSENSASSPEPRQTGPRGLSAQPDMSGSPGSAAPNGSSSPASSMEDRVKHKHEGPGRQSPRTSASATPPP